MESFLKVLSEEVKGVDFFFTPFCEKFKGVESFLKVLNEEVKGVENSTTVSVFPKTTFAIP